MKQDYLEAALKKAQQTGRAGPEIDPYTGAPRKRPKTNQATVDRMVMLALDHIRVRDGKLKAPVEESREPVDAQAPDPNPLSLQDRLDQLAKAADEHLKLFAYRYSVPYQQDGESFDAYRQRIAQGIKRWCACSALALGEPLPNEPPPAPEDPQQDPVPERYPKAPETFEPSLRPGDILEGKPLRLDPIAVESALPQLRQQEPQYDNALGNVLGAVASWKDALEGVYVETVPIQYTTTVTGRIKRDNEITWGSMPLPGGRSVALVSRLTSRDCYERAVRFGDGQEAVEGTGVFGHYAPQIERHLEDQRSCTPKGATHVMRWIDLEADPDEMSEIARFIGQLAPEFIAPNGRLVDGFALHLVNRHLWADTIGKGAIKGRQIGDERHARMFRDRWGQHLQELEGAS